MTSNLMDYRVYLETTMFNRFLEEGREFCRETRLMFEKFRTEKLIPYTSTYAVEELLNAPSPKKEQMLKLIPEYGIVVLDKTEDAEILADVYVQSGVVPVKCRTDGVHIATATINVMDFIISLNFTHINKARTRLLIEAVNRLKDYDTPIICTPAEVVYDDWHSR